jgi:alpha-galactosidase
MMREAADIMITSGMADVGYQYVNIDDCWMNAHRNNDTLRAGPLRDGQGNMIPNRHFPDMPGLSAYIHSKGLKAGIYSSPGMFTCGNFAGSYQHEEQDARQFAAWGFDFLKYDWCSYGQIAGKDSSLEAFQKPYRKMGNIIKTLDRDMVFNLCQYGMGEVWKWGGEVGGNCWRTAGDLGFELDRFFEVALRNSEYRQYSKPGEWNDPDYIQIGWIGNASNMGIPALTPMSDAMQYSYMSLWCLMAAPLIYSGDMSKLDEFTLNVLCNPEIIEVDQDPLGESGMVIRQSDNRYLMIKNLADGSKAVGLFNRGNSTMEIQADWGELQISWKQAVRDLWRQKELGVYTGKFSTQVPAHGVVMIKVTKL